MANKTHTYSKLAEQDLIDIYLYSARTWGQKQADSYDAGLKHAIGRLVDSPDIGRACDEIKVVSVDLSINITLSFTASERLTFSLCVSCMKQWTSEVVYPAPVNPLLNLTQ
ncbi:hypothetical protein THO17_12660 [Marinomonas sp. THO17]